MASISTSSPRAESSLAPQPDYKAMRAQLVGERTLQYTAGGLVLGMIIGPEGTGYILDLIASGIDSRDVLSVVGRRSEIAWQTRKR